MTKEIVVNKFTTTYTSNKDGYVVNLFGDGVLISQTEFGYSVPIEEGQRSVLFNAENYGEYTKDFNTRYSLAVPPIAPQQPATQPPSPTAQKDKDLKQPRYQPSFTYSKPKSTSGGEFVVRSTQQDYRGQYVETSDDKYYAGTKPEDNGAELEKVRSNASQLLGIASPFVLSILKGFFKPTVKKGDRERGSTKRYFLQSKSSKKITETDLDSFVLANTQLPNYTFAQVDWIIQGPADDQMINGYPFEGAASKNKKAIQALEAQMPGISTFVTNYSELVEEPVSKKDLALDSQTIVVEDPLTKLENDRKANFDLRN